ncbi:MAG: dermonecrotic toxin domain-containing protein, partial [Luteibacter jiangsuensis]
AGEAGAYVRVANAIGRHATDAPPARNPLSFATAADVTAFEKLSGLVKTAPIPDARQLAKALIVARLGIDGDAYTVAHFASPEQRAKGVPDQTTTLTEAVMQAFPDHGRHSLLAVSSDLVGGVFGGGRQSVDVVGFADRLWHGRSAKEMFASVGRFLWSRTGPGYVYNAFVAEGNVVQTVGEDARPLDEAFGVFRAGGFAAEHDSGLRLSQVVALFEAPGTFEQLPYVTKLDAALDRYWGQVRGDWPVLARYEFVQQARRAHAAGLLSDAQYRQAMAGGAPGVPLSGPITLAQLRDHAPATGVQVRRFDINGYTASDLVRFIAPDGSEVMYVPGGTPAFVVAGSERELRQWVLDQAKAPAALEALLGHFSTYRAQDGVFWTGVKQGLQNLGSGRWQADTGSIDHANEAITGDVFQDMRAQVEARLREDAHMQVKTAWEGWRTTIGRWSALMLPISFFPPVSLEVQILTTAVGLGTGIEQGIDGKTAEERKAGVAGVLSTAVNTALIGGSMAGRGGEVRSASSGVADEKPTFVAPSRVNGKLGYPLSPTVPPGWRMDAVNRLYRLRDGTPGIWFAEETERHMVRLPADAAPRSDGVFVHGTGRFVQLILRGGLRTARVVPDVSGYRLLLEDGSEGPRVERQPSGTWKLAVDGANFMAGSMLAEIVRRDFTADARTLHRAAAVLEQFGVSETALAEGWSAEGGATREPMLILALGHGFLETIPARLRDPRAVVWSAREVALLAQAMSRLAGRPLAFYRP